MLKNLRKKCPMYKRSETWAGETSKLRPMELTRELRISALCEELPRELYAWVGGGVWLYLVKKNVEQIKILDQVL